LTGVDPIVIILPYDEKRTEHRIENAACLSAAFTLIRRGVEEIVRLRLHGGAIPAQNVGDALAGESRIEENSQRDGAGFGLVFHKDSIYEMRLQNVSRFRVVISPPAMGIVRRRSSYSRPIGFLLSSLAHWG